MVSAAAFGCWAVAETKRGFAAVMSDGVWWSSAWRGFVFAIVGDWQSQSKHSFPRESVNSIIDSIS